MKSALEEELSNLQRTLETATKEYTVGELANLQRTLETAKKIKNALEELGNLPRTLRLLVKKEKRTGRGINQPAKILPNC